MLAVDCLRLDLLAVSWIFMEFLASAWPMGFVCGSAFICLGLIEFACILLDWPPFPAFVVCICKDFVGLGDICLNLYGSACIGLV